MRLIQVAEPAREPITLGEVKDHLRIDGDEEDALLDTTITTARMHIERIISRPLITQTFDLLLDGFPAWHDCEIAIPRPPLQSITSINYVDFDGAPQLLAASEYQHDIGGNDPARLRPAYQKQWPQTREQLNAVTIRFVAGYGDIEAKVPKPIIHALKLLMSAWDLNREPYVISGGSFKELPFAVQTLLAPYVQHIR